MIVLKLGGSLGKGQTLRNWLAALTQGGRRAVVVPGGGAFADVVREQQAHLRFSDRAAHRMAILAMEQYAWALADMSPTITPCARESEMRDALARGLIPVWLPSEMALADREIPESWEVTSDSLSAWLARKLGAERLVRVKSAPAPRSLDPELLASRGLVDGLFPHFLAGAQLTLDWIGPGEEDRLADLLSRQRDRP
jgi:5-(aminomethyl)-3-furanmethanol phosphate kinase